MLRFIPALVLAVPSPLLISVGVISSTKTHPSILCPHHLDKTSDIIPKISVFHHEFKQHFFCNGMKNTLTHPQQSQTQLYSKVLCVYLCVLGQVIKCLSSYKVETERKYLAGCGDTHLYSQNLEDWGRQSSVSGQPELHKWNSVSRNKTKHRRREKRRKGGREEGKESPFFPAGSQISSSSVICLLQVLHLALALGLYQGPRCPHTDRADALASVKAGLNPLHPLLCPSLLYLVFCVPFLVLICFSTIFWILHGRNCAPCNFEFSGLSRGLKKTRLS